jgi:hypothetical protein
VPALNVHRGSILWKDTFWSLLKPFIHAGFRNWSNFGVKISLFLA